MKIYIISDLLIFFKGYICYIAGVIEKDNYSLLRYKSAKYL